MKKLLIRVLALALLVLAVILLHRRVQYEAEEAERLAVEAMERGGILSEDAREHSRLRSGDGVVLGRMAENTELGGVDITVNAGDGTEKTYTFTDVAIDSWYADAVNFVVSAGLMDGIADSLSFQPEYGMPRESFALVLYRFAGGAPAGTSTGLADVKPGMWYEDAVNWAVSEGLMLPLEGDVFGVGAYMTCEQALVGLYRLAGEPETDGALTDYPYAAKVSDYGRRAVDWAWRNGLISEVECVWYPPQAISRAQIALLLTRLSEKIA